MQTFVPYPDFYESARVMDKQRLWKQVVEAKQIYRAITIPGYGWRHHPAVKMWKQYPQALLQYAITFGLVAAVRRVDSLGLVRELQSLVTDPTSPLPHWWGDERVHRSHRCNLLMKDWKHYYQIFNETDIEIPYYWPSEFPPEGETNES